MNKSMEAETGGTWEQKLEEYGDRDTGNIKTEIRKIWNMYIVYIKWWKAGMQLKMQLFDMFV